MVSTMTCEVLNQTETRPPPGRSHQDARRRERKLRTVDFRNAEVEHLHDLALAASREKQARRLDVPMDDAERVRLPQPIARLDDVADGDPVRERSLAGDADRQAWALLHAGTCSAARSGRASPGS
jgi:hypothetical protein